MGKFENAIKIGLRDKQTKRLIAVYPFPFTGSDLEIEQAVRDWHYQQDCESEEELRKTIVDVLNEDEIKSLA